MAIPISFQLLITDEPLLIMNNRVVGNVVRLVMLKDSSLYVIVLDDCANMTMLPVNRTYAGQLLKKEIKRLKAACIEEPLFKGSVVEKRYYRALRLFREASPSKKKNDIMISKFEID